MSARASRIPETLAAVHTLWANDSDLIGVQVSYGIPTEWGRRVVALTGNVSDIAHEYHSIAPTQPRDEGFKIEFIVTVLVPGYTLRQSIEEAFRILGILDLKLRTNQTLQLDPSVAGPVLWSRVSPERVETAATDETWETEITCGIVCMARI